MARCTWGYGRCLLLCLEIVLLEAFEDFPLSAVVGGDDATTIICPMQSCPMNQGLRESILMDM